MKRCFITENYKVCAKNAMIMQSKCLNGQATWLVEMIRETQSTHITTGTDDRQADAAGQGGGAKSEGLADKTGRVLFLYSQLEKIGSL